MVAGGSFPPCLMEDNLQAMAVCIFTTRLFIKGTKIRCAHKNPCKRIYTHAHSHTHTHFQLSSKTRTQTQGLMINSVDFKLNTDIEWMWSHGENRPGNAYRCEQILLTWMGSVEIKLLQSMHGIFIFYYLRIMKSICLLGDCSLQNQWRLMICWSTNHPVAHQLAQLQDKVSQGWASITLHKVHVFLYFSPDVQLDVGADRKPLLTQRDLPGHGCQVTQQPTWKWRGE